MIKRSVIRTWRITLATLLLLAAGNVLALGLGQIEVKSRINQPLLAEIPIVSTTPGELQALQARLASPETFRRVGLQPPTGIAADLRFSLGNDARGRPVIRVTTVAPVTQAVLNFLIEVDWGQGRLVREYSALVDAPRTASAPLQPAIIAPVVAAPNVVQRPVAPVGTPITTAPLKPQPDAPAAPRAMVPAAVAKPAPQPMPVAEPAPATSTIMPVPRVSQPAAVPATRKVVAAAQAPAAARSQYGPIKAGETLSKIATSLDRASPYSLDQTMLALLRANPDAFLNDNINLLRQGAVLRVPGSEDKGSISVDEAQLVVREQMQQWRQAKRPVILPDAVIAGNAPKLGGAAARPADAAKPTTTTSAPTATAKSAKAPQQTQARLAIVPAAVPGKATGTRSGTNAGGEGKMLQQQLQQRDEDLAARAAEISDLKERVAELENLKQQQDQLLTMKDTELAAVQQRLADARNAVSVAAPAEPAAAAVTQTSQPAQEPQPHASNMMPWLWGGLAVVGLGMLVWLLSRRRPAPVARKPHRGLDNEALAASMRRPAAPATTESDPQPVLADVEQVMDVSELPTTPGAHVEAPTWHSGRSMKADAEPGVGTPAASSPRFVPPVDAPSPEFIPDALNETLPEPVSSEQRMKLARAFLDIGDDHSAKQLLLELLDGPDPAMRTDAAKLLRELG
ncbi:MAG: FimV family protein [Thermomonas sp.]